MKETITGDFEIELKHLIEAIHHRYSYDFRQYTPASIKRSVVHAMNRMECHTLAVLQEKVLHDAECFIDLIQSLTIPVSEMFREPSYFRSLREQILPFLKTYPSLKIWIAGCSTGEEAYSLAIILQEADMLERTTLYATDINQRSLETAEKGTFNLKALESASLNYQKSGGTHSLSDYYTVTGNQAIFNRTLQENITFFDHSLATDTVFSEMHLISCRNVLIYFNRELQNRVFALFHESLCRKGFLGLGAYETIQFSKSEKYFEPFVKVDRIFRKK